MANEETTPTPTQASTIKEAISAKIKESNPLVLSGLIDELVEKEIRRRKETIKAGIEKYEELEISLKKMKPDNITFNQDGSQASSSWSKDALDKFNKATKELEQLNTALDNAINNINYDQLHKLTK